MNLRKDRVQEYNADRWAEKNDVFSTKKIVKVKNDYLESRIEDVGMIWDDVMAEDVTRHTGEYCNGEFVRRFRRKHDIKASYPSLRNVRAANKIGFLILRAR